jgi:predicted 2-oxoglutarate/Fe(II)-dependent dioxygenase YbiX
MDGGEMAPAEVVDGLPVVDRSVRDALDVTIDPALLDLVDERLVPHRDLAARHFGLVLSGSVGASCLRYPPGGHYQRHRDRDPDFGPGTDDRQLTVVVWLNSAETRWAPGDFGGGTLRVFAPDGGTHDMIPRAGTLVVFPADWPHEVLPVTRGLRDVVVDWWL